MEAMITCHNCGAKIPVVNGMESIQCEYCRTIIRVDVFEKSEVPVVQQQGNTELASKDNSAKWKNDFKAFLVIQFLLTFFSAASLQAAFIGFFILLLFLSSAASFVFPIYLGIKKSALPSPADSQRSKIVNIIIYYFIFLAVFWGGFILGLGITSLLSI